MFLQCKDQQVGFCLGMKTLKGVVIKGPFRPFFPLCRPFWGELQPLSDRPPRSQRLTSCETDSRQRGIAASCGDKADFSLTDVDQTSRLIQPIRGGEGGGVGGVRRVTTSLILKCLNWL